jgi:hypothetical protein
VSSGEAKNVKTYARENADARARLKTLAERLTDSDLSRRMKHDWTVSMALAHMAFWDGYALALLTRWEKMGFSPSAGDWEIVNDALRPLIKSIPPREAVGMALSAAEAVDQKVEELPEELTAAIESGGRARILNRSLHRTEHLDDIEHALGGG